MTCWGWVLAPGLSRPLGTSLEPIQRALWAHGFFHDEVSWWTRGWQGKAPSRWATVLEVS